MKASGLSVGVVRVSTEWYFLPSEIRLSGIKQGIRCFSCDSLSSNEIIASYFATSYSYVKNPVYFYNFGRGVSSNNKIETLARWERICSSSTVFTILKTLIPTEIQLNEDQKIKLQKFCNGYLFSLIHRLNNYVDISLKNSAKEILDNYWGKEYVNELKGNN